MVTTTLYVRQQKRHRCIEQSFGVCGRGRGRMIWENGIKTCTISYKNKSPVPVRCRIQAVWGWCTGMTQRDGMGREVHGEHLYRMFRMGNTSTLMVDACLCMGKPIQYCKVKNNNNKNKISKRKYVYKKSIYTYSIILFLLKIRKICNM